LNESGAEAMSVNFRLNHKVVVVTGAGGVIGCRASEVLLEAGAKVALLDIDIQNLETLGKKLSKIKPSNLMIVECDVSSADSVKKSVDTVVQKWDSVDVLFNNAASKSDNIESFFAPFEDYSIECWRSIMSVNIDGMMLMAQAVGKQMLKQGRGGSMIQTASIYGLVAPDQRIYEGSRYLETSINTPAVYSVSKGAVVALTKYLAAYWGTKGIRVNTLTPGGVESGQNDVFKRKYSERVPLGRMARVDDLMGAILYLASDASSYVTGQNLVVDGGWTTW